MTTNNLKIQGLLYKLSCLERDAESIRHMVRVELANTVLASEPYILEIVYTGIDCGLYTYSKMYGRAQFLNKHRPQNGFTIFTVVPPNFNSVLKLLQHFKQSIQTNEEIFHTIFKCKMDRAAIITHLNKVFFLNYISSLFISSR